MDISFSLAPYDPLQTVPAAESRAGNLLALPDTAAGRKIVARKSRRWAIALVVLMMAGCLLFGSAVLARPYIVPEFTGEVALDKSLVPTLHGGRVAALFVREGQQVEAGAPLFSIEAPTLQAKAAQLQATLEAAEQLAEQSRTRARSVIAQSRIFLDASRMRLRRELARMQRLERLGEATRAEVLTIQSDLFQLELRLNEVGRQEQEVEVGPVEAQLREQKLQIQRELSEIQLAQQQLRVVAPISGRVTTLLAREGSPVQAHENVVVIAPPGIPTITVRPSPQLLRLIESGRDFFVELPEGGRTPILYDGMHTEVGKNSVPSGSAENALGTVAPASLRLLVNFRLPNSLQEKYAVDGFPVVVAAWPPRLLAIAEKIERWWAGRL